jgi:transglutaminase/protease-like cytokinesis protein 3
MPTKASRNFSSIQETYPLLRRVAEDLQYSDLKALQDSFRKYKPLPTGYYYELYGKKFYSNQDLFDYKIQRAKEWGNKNDQNNDGEINCEDYAELFYKYASDAGYKVRYIVNSNLNHAFNQVRIQNEWVAIEPQSAEDGLGRLPLESTRFPAYNPMYDKIRKEN